MSKIQTFEDKYYVYVPAAVFKLSKQEWADFLEKYANNDVSNFAYQQELLSAIRRFRNR